MIACQNACKASIRAQKFARHLLWRLVDTTCSQFIEHSTRRQHAVFYMDDLPSWSFHGQETCRKTAPQPWLAFSQTRLNFPSTPQIPTVRPSGLARSTLLRTRTTRPWMAQDTPRRHCKLQQQAASDRLPSAHPGLRSLACRMSCQTWPRAVEHLHVELGQHETGVHAGFAQVSLGGGVHLGTACIPNFP